MEDWGFVNVKVNVNESEVTDPGQVGGVPTEHCADQQRLMDGCDGLVSLKKPLEKTRSVSRIILMKIQFLCTLAIVGSLSSTLSAATLVFKFEETGSDLKLTVSGSWSSLANWQLTSAGATGNPTYIQSNFDYIRATPASINLTVSGKQVDVYTWQQEPDPWGPHPTERFGNGGDISYGTDYLPTSAGDSVAFQAEGTFIDLFTMQHTFKATLSLPKDYVLGSNIITSATFAGKSFNSLQLGPLGSSYDFQYGPDKISVIIAVPEPSALSLLAIGLGGVIALRRCRRSAV